MLHDGAKDEFGAVDSLMVLKNQITSRIAQLNSMLKEKTKVDNSNSSGNAKTAEPNKALTAHSPSPLPYTSTLQNVSIQLFNSTLADIETSLLKNLNIRISNAPSNTRNFKIPLINKDQINQIEHSLQLLNFKGSDDLKLRNEYLTKLNMLYYSEMLAEQQTIKDVVSVIKDVESIMESDNKWKKVDQITDDSVTEMLGELQQRISGLEREKLHMENQIVRLKERWNTLVENVRRRKETEDVSDTKFYDENLDSH